MTVIFALLTILVCLGLDVAVRRLRARVAVPAAAVQSAPGAYPVRLPDGIFFARSHTWMSLFPSGKIRLGVDDFVGRLLDAPEVKYLKGVGDTMRKGDPLIALSEGGRTLTLRAPMDGRIVGVNEELLKRPELLKENLFSEGWAYTIRPERPSELRQMLLGEETRGWIAEEFRRLRDLFTREGGKSEIAPALLQDGGPPVSGALKCEECHVWELFDRMFLCEP